VAPLRTIQVTRYVTPLREGGSLPAIVEADDDGLYVLKFRGSGQGPKALIAELVSGELGRALGLPVPEIVFAQLHADFARTEPDPEIHALIHDSAGLNLAIDFLPGSVSFDPLVHQLPADLASQILWFDALTTNVDRTARNTNMLVWHRRTWLIDHGATLYFHHAPGWQEDRARARAPFTQIDAHVLRRSATRLSDVDETLASMLTREVIGGILAQVPDDWLLADGAASSGADVRSAYARYLGDRLQPPRPFVREATHGR
jgi:hypothetical protein